MIRINYLTLIGSALVLLALLSPWFNFNLPLRYQLDGEWKNIMAHCYISPFILSVNITETSQRTYYSDIAVLTNDTTYFYNAKSSAFGIALIIACALGFLGEFRDRRNLTLICGLITSLSTIFFYLALPPYVLTIAWNTQLWSILWSFWVSLFGSAIILVSVPFRMWVLKQKYKEDLKPYAVSGYLESG